MGSGRPRGAHRRRGLVGAGVVAFLLQPTPVWSCSVCFGSGDPDASGFAWGVLILLVPVAVVQVALLWFLLRAANRERRQAEAQSVPGALPDAARRVPS